MLSAHIQRSLISIHSRSISSAVKLTNIKKLVGFKRDDTFITEIDCEVVIDNGKILKFGRELAIDEATTTVIDTKGALVTPGFIDPHTHIFPPTDRSNEFAMRVNQTYQEIAAAGGGILSSVKACREATYEQIYAVNDQNVKRFIALGTTTLEMKSGYGLNLETEIKLLQVINKLKKKYSKQIEIVPTFLGAHAFPPEYKERKDDYVNLICTEMLPEISKQRLAEYCDVFCENGYFSYEQSLKILTAAKELKFKLRLHADEFEDSRGAELAAQLKAHSADHLMAISDNGINHLAQDKVVATMLPGTTIFLGKNTFAPARRLIEKGVRVAIASDYNPGSSVFNCQPMMMNFAMTYGKLTVEEAFKAVTRNAALALGRTNVGIIDEGAQADLLIWNLDNISQIPYYHYESTQRITHYVKKGKVYPKKK